MLLFGFYYFHIRLRGVGFPGGVPGGFVGGVVVGSILPIFKKCDLVLHVRVVSFRLSNNCKV